MDSPVEYQAAIHRASTPGEVASILKRFLATLNEEESRALHPALTTVETFSEQGMRGRALAAKRAAGSIDARDPAAHVVAATGKVISTAALRISVLQMDAKNAGRTRRKGWF